MLLPFTASSRLSSFWPRLGSGYETENYFHFPNALWISGISLGLKDSIWEQNFIPDNNCGHKDNNKIHNKATIIIRCKEYFIIQDPEIIKYFYLSYKYKHFWILVLFPGIREMLD